METEKRVKDIIAQTLCIDEKISNDAHLSNDLGMDSLDAVELMMNCEREFNIRISDEDVMGIETVGEYVTLIKKQTGEA